MDRGGKIAKETDHLHLFVRGRVQGVGFRYSVLERAQELGVVGWVRNCPDGSVEIECEGERVVLETFLDWCRQGPRFARVDNVNVEWSTGPVEYESFEITR